MVRRSHRVVWILLALVLPAVLLTSVHTPFAQEGEESVQSLFERGMALYRQGYYAYNEDRPGVPHGAMYYFERVKRLIANEPDRRRALLIETLIREAGYSTLQRMRQASHRDEVVAGQVRAFAEWLQSNATRGSIARSTNRDAIVRDLTVAFTDSSSDTQLRMMETIRERYGEFAVPEIHRMFLHSGNRELMARAMSLLSTIGRPAVMPLIELMKSPRLYDRMHSASVLGDLRDTRAVPALVEHLQREETEVEVQREIRLALEKILGPLGTRGDTIDAKQHYYQLALQYYHHMPELIAGRTDAFVLWRWVPENPDAPRNGGFLDYEVVPTWAYMDALAEEACLGALRLDPNFDAAWDLLVSVNLRQHLESESRLDGIQRARLAARAGQMGPVAWQEVDREEQRMRELFDRYHRGLVLAGTAGQEALYRAIDRALSDRQAELAVAAIQKLTAVGDARYIPKARQIQQPEDVDRYVGAPLIRALQYVDKRVRYAAAQALFSLNNNRQTDFEPFYLMDIARDVLIQGLGESAQRSILVVTNNLDLRNNMRQALDELGYYVTFAETPSEGLRRAQSFPSDDLILVDIAIANQPVRTFDPRGGTGQTSQTIFDLLKQDFRTRDIDVVLLVDAGRYSDEGIRGEGGLFFNEFQSGAIIDILGYRDNRLAPLPADLGVFQDVWRRRQLDAKDRANRMAIDSAKALLTWSPDDIGQLNNDQFFHPVIRALVARVNDARTNTDVKVAMLRALVQFVQAKDTQKYPVSLWNQDVIPNLLPVLNAAPHIHQPIVKYWTCRVLADIYKNRPGDARWTEQANHDPWQDRARDPNQNIFWALFNLLEFNPTQGELAALMPDGMDEAEEAQWWIAHTNTVRMVREAAGEVMGTAPMNSAQRLYANDRARVNQPIAIHYGPAAGRNR